MDPTRESRVLSAKLDASWARRVKEAESWNLRLLNGEIQPGLLRRTIWALRGKEAKKVAEKKWREVEGRKEASLAWALNDTFGLDFWLGGLYKVCIFASTVVGLTRAEMTQVLGDTSQLMGPLLVKAIINFGKAHALAHAKGTTPPPVARGVVLAIGTFLVTVTASVCQHQFFWRSMTTGVLARAALIGSIYERGVGLTGKARTTGGLGNGALVNHISTDVSGVLCFCSDGSELMPVI
jgi:ATP-binding cassette subfamily C (CFTR/MRP) protein 1